MKRVIMFMLTLILLFSPGCYTEEDAQIVITDRTGKVWDISHAVSRYDFAPEGFQFGLGPFAIQPILDPEFAGPGDADYPDSEDNVEVLGVELEGESRAYPMTVMSRHEVVDDMFGDVPVAVAY